ncbi:nicotinamide riboside transporter PnuC [Pseudoclavibacter sp. 13-3]|uniref:nicotinamide riboside transporter PnuC n=1 Tax=Pseudoclavibacter sp. 13-3 TaxID=2901228 RepID=UPI001E44E108|nr:nicotinamide riboside transporter PnuC [Pseudoclavibacter sp. 13-3]
MDSISWLYNATIPLGDLKPLVLREVVGNVFGLASALGGMRRKVWAWPVGIIGNALLFSVFLGAILSHGEAATLLGQAGRQIMFIAVSVWGWRQWRQSSRQRRQGTSAAEAASLVGQAVPAAQLGVRAAADAEPGHRTAVDRESGVSPVWATGRQRAVLAGVMVLGTIALTPLFRLLGSYEPVWADAWTFVGSLLATYGMARRWVEFWLIWVAVDVVGVPLLLSAGYYATAVMYIFYGVFTLTGFFVWRRVDRRHRMVG